MGKGNGTENALSFESQYSFIQHVVEAYYVRGYLSGMGHCFYIEKEK